MVALTNSRISKNISILISVWVLCVSQLSLAGSIVSWGGDRNDEDFSLPPEGIDFVAVAAGERHNLGLKVDGSIVAWGFGTENQGRWPSYGQVIAPDGNDFAAIAAGAYHSLALRSDGSLAVWGLSLGAPPTGNNFVAIAGGGAFIGFLSPAHEPLVSVYGLALKSDGSIVSWGNLPGENSPPDGNDFIAVAAGDSHSLALRSDGSLVGWGTVGWDVEATPPDGNDFIAIAAGGSHSLALKADGSVIGWGNDEYGQATPPDGNDFVAIAAGGSHSLALRSDGSIVGWGDNSCGQATPPDGNDFTAIAAGSVESLAIRETTAKYSGGTGEPNDPYQIATAQDLMLLGQTTEDYDKHFILTADIDIDPNLPGRKVFNKAVIAPDINDIEDGFQGTPFTGFFDGNDHAIYHLKIEGKSNLGLFGQVAPGARISKLCLESVDVNGTGDYIGSLAGGNAGSVSESCSNGTIRGINNVGGLFGSNCESITMCYSTGTVNGNTNVGGLVGGNSIDILFSYRTGSILRVDTNMRITKSYSTSNISGNGSVGGIVGYNDSFGVVIMSYSAGVVKGSLRVGGLIGRNAGGIETCYSTAVVVGTTDVGGLAGSSTSPYPIATGGYATHSFWDIQTSGQAISAGGIGFTTAEMQTASIFIEAGWDFVYETTNGTDDIWWIDEGNDYPRLWWEPRFEPYQMVVSGYVDITTVYQELEGFGASGIWWDRAVIAHPLKNLIYDCIFGQLGLDIYKLRNAYEIPNGEEYIINSGEIVSAAQLSLGHPIKIMISSLTPPAYLKSNSDTAGGTLAGSARGGGYRYDMFAQWWLDSLAEYSAYGITADYISIQSSPDVQAGSVYDSCKFTPTETTDYAGYNVAFETVYQKLNSEMTIMPKMLAPETWSYYSPQEYIDALIEQNNVFGFGHRDGDFGDPDSFIQNMENFAAQYGHKPLFTMSFNNDEVSFNAAMNLAISIHNRMVYENLCSFILSDLFKGEGTEGGLVTIDNPWDEFNPGYTINPVYYAFKQYSAFTDPGWHRVEISIDSDELRACAFISPDEDQLSIIIINTSVVGINLMLTLENFITENSGVYRTSENENAAYIGTFDNTEPLSLPAQSITTVNLVD